MELKDIGGLQQIKGIKLQGATQWLGTSANVAAMDSTDGSAMTFSLTNYSVLTSAAFDCANTDGETNAVMIAKVIATLAAAGIVSETHDGS